MTSLRLDHVAVAVHDLDEAIAHYRDVWGLEASQIERVDDQAVDEAMLPLGPSSLQLIAPASADSTVAGFLERRGQGLHHIALAVDDLESMLAELAGRGIELVDRSPRAGGGGHRVAFVHPQASHGVLIELVERRTGQ